MKKILTLSIISASLLVAGPVHDIMDSKLKGKSFGGTLDDHEAASDGLGIIPLNGYSPSRDVANELIETKIFKKVLKSETDKTKISHIRNSLSSGLVGSIEDKNILSNVGVVLNYVPGTLSSCSEIKTKFPTSSTGVYELSDGFMAKCDMSSSGVELYNNNLNSCSEIESRFDITSLSSYILADGSTVQCNPDGSKYVPTVWKKFMRTVSGACAENLPIVSQSSIDSGNHGVSSEALSKVTNKFKLVTSSGTYYWTFNSSNTIFTLFSGNSHKTVSIKVPSGNTYTGIWNFSQNTSRFSTGSKFSSDDGILPIPTADGWTVIGNNGGVINATYIGNYNGSDSTCNTADLYYE